MPAPQPEALLAVLFETVLLFSVRVPAELPKLMPAPVLALPFFTVMLLSVRFPEAAVVSST